MTEENDLELTEGSKYIITSLGSRDEPIKSTGEFCGYLSIGNGGAVCIKLDKSHKGMGGKMRIIPTHMILAIDVVKKAKKHEDEDVDSTSKSYL
ncbi:MAG: hypothetical protein JSV49_07105 [Thermoplasmata archaeon]|nr:MAG: hypothetical protein JSV49_07105 [Thermoplasmata archaeon]